MIYYVGGPGSNKRMLIDKAVRRVPGWAHISVGLLLRQRVGSRDIPLAEAQSLKNTIAAGELVDKVRYVLNR